LRDRRGEVYRELLNRVASLEEIRTSRDTAQRSFGPGARPTLGYTSVAG